MKQGKKMCRAIACLGPGLAFVCVRALSSQLTELHGPGDDESDVCRLPWSWDDGMISLKLF